MEDNITSPGPRFLTCPICEAGRLLDLGRESSRCDYCGCLMGGLVVRMIREITSLPDATGKHACECGHRRASRVCRDASILQMAALRSDGITCRCKGRTVRLSGVFL